MGKIRYIVVEGNIGAGKTSLVNKLTQDLNGIAVLEEFAENTFLPEFYKNSEKYAFPLELSFLAARYNQLKHVFENESSQVIISDYHIQKSLLFSSITLNKTELNLYRSFFDLISSQFPEPDLVIYLKKDVSHLLENINKRGRDFEKNIDADYLNKINQEYARLVATYPFRRLLKFESDNLDFINKNRDYETILNSINN